MSNGTKKREHDEESMSIWQSMTQHFNVRTFVSGGLAGSMAKTLVAPIDRVKILLQVHNVHYEGYGIFESFYQVYKKEGFLSLYKGNGAQMLRIFPYAAMQFTSYEMYKSLNKRLFKQKADYLINNLACGSLAGITAVTVTYPLDVIRSRLAFQYKGEHIYTGILDSIRKIYLEKNSIVSFYRGYAITVLGMIPYAGLSFTSFERLKKFFLNQQFPVLTVENKLHDNTKKNNDKNIADTHGYYELSVIGKLVCGAFTGVIAQTVTYPLDVVRRHMQLVTMLTDSVVRQKMGIYDTLIYVYNKYGVVRGLYRGITLNYVRAIPMVSTSFCFYEISKKFFGLQVGELVKLG